MRIVRTIGELRRALSEHRPTGATVGLVPTMGGFHAGHLSLIERASADCDVVVVSLFVNPTQFNDPRDLEAYPRDERRDAALAEAHGVDVLFVPAPEELYPTGFATTVSVGGITERLEGAHRGHGHFDGVATVVSKLLNIVSPDVAYFGQKDAQQALVVRRLVADLNLPVRIAVCPTVREADGLALSSRNVRLSAEERARAAALFRALCAIQDAFEQGERDPAAARRRGLDELEAAAVTVEYLELVSPETLETVHGVQGEVLAVVAGRVGSTRLIDNLLIHVPAALPAARDSTLDENTPQPVSAGAAENDETPQPVSAGAAENGSS
jgi:pantoate--beta-alanine ligase